MLFFNEMQEHGNKSSTFHYWRSEMEMLVLLCGLVRNQEATPNDAAALLMEYLMLPRSFLSRLCEARVSMLREGGLYRKRSQFLQSSMESNTQHVRAALNRCKGILIPT